MYTYKYINIYIPIAEHYIRVSFSGKATQLTAAATQIGEVVVVGVVVATDWLLGLVARLKFKRDN